ncbi:MAG: leucine-rich repeat protein [Bacteroidaceae bacterium]|nr:leucine-rich repeat protein [Bacteroidaceae bacterium]
MKRTILKSMMVVLGVLLSVHANADENGVLIEGVYYNLVTTSKTATVTNGGTAYTGAVTIPATVTWEDITYDVTAISMEAFKNCTGLTSISIPSSVSTISGQAFYGCTGLTAVTIPDGVTSIGNEAFSTCYNLATVVIGDDVKTIGDYAFFYCDALTELILGKRVETIGSYAFAGRYSGKLTSVTIPRSVTFFGDRAFSGRNNLTAVHITDLAAWCGVMAGGDYANPLDLAGHLYLNGAEVKELVIPDGVKTINNLAFKNCQGLRTVTIPKSVTNINHKAFYNCDNLNTVNIEGNGTDIASYAFADCYYLNTLNISGSIASFGEYAFNGCNNLNKLDITDLAAWCNVTIKPYSNPLDYAHQLWVNGTKITDLVIPNGVTAIKGGVFSHLTGLKSVSIPSSVTSIGDASFQYCSNLESVSIPNSVTSIGAGAFMGCSGLTSLTMPNSITSIGTNAFQNCSGMTNVELSSGLTAIPNYAFAGCTGLTSVVIPEGVTSVGDYAFQNCSAMTSVEIPSTVNWLGKYDFDGCTALSEVGITDLAAWCQMRFGAEKASPFFYAKTMKLNGEPVTDLVFPEGISTIGAYTFAEYKGLKSVLISNDVTSVAKGAFQGCTGLKDVTIGSSVTSLGQYAFRNCTGMQNLVIGNSVNNIGSQTFENCGNLRSIVVVKGNSKYDSRDNCNALIVTATNALLLGCRNTVIPEGIKSIGSYAFRNGRGLSYLNIPNSVTTFDYNPFYDSDLKEVEIHCSINTSSLFWERTNLQTIVLGEEVKSIESSTFYGCANMQTVISYIQEPFAFGSSAFDFDNVYNTCKLIVPAGTRDAYIAKGWTESVFKGGVVEADPNSFVVADQTVNRGATVTIPIELNNVTPVTAFQFEVNLPEGITWSRCTLTDRKDDHIISAKKQATGNYMVTAISLSDESFSGTSGAIAKLELKVDGQQIAGLYRLNIKNIGLTAEDGSELHPLDVSNTLAINDFTLGDTNGDGNVTITDAVMVVSHVLGNDPEGFVSNAADMNDSGDITITDAVAIIKIVLDGQKTHAAERRTGVMVLDPQ